jgi:DNA (cytosine-5)-methyltransferase 1
MNDDELIVDSFAGGGGASLGIAWALGRAPDIAINHDPSAIEMHAANHPSTEHVLEDVWRADLRKLVGGRKVGLLWLSPDCKHFSRAKGAKPVEKKIRSLAWIACKWASEIGPRVIALENVREFADWGPIVPRLVCKDCDWKGTSGQAILMRKNYKCPCCDSKRLKKTDELVPCPDRKGATFKRFVGRLRNLGYHVEWRNLDAADYGAPTHRKRLFLIARNDGEPITWPDPTHCSPGKLDAMPLFDQLKPYRTAAECIDWSIECPSIFTRKNPLADKTMRRIALGIKRYVLDSSEPFIVQTSHAGTTGRVAPVLSRYNGSKTDTDDRCQQLESPFTTLDTQPRFALLSPTLVSITHNGERKPIDPNEPLPTITTAHRGEIGLVSAFIAKHFGGMVGVEVDTPLPTTTGKGCQNQLVAANLVHLNHGTKQWSGVDEPTRTITSSGTHAALVYSFLVKYFGTAIGASLHEPAPTTTSKDRFGLVTVQVNGEPYVIIDIGMRMLTPRELARAQGFPDTYLLTGTKTSQVARIGNSVCPHVAAAIVRANCVEGVIA